MRTLFLQFNNPTRQDIAEKYIVVMAPSRDIKSPVNRCHSIVTLIMTIYKKLSEVPQTKGKKNLNNQSIMCKLRVIQY